MDKNIRGKIDSIVVKCDGYGWISKEGNKTDKICNYWEKCLNGINPCMYLIKNKDEKAGKIGIILETQEQVLLAPTHICNCVAISSAIKRIDLSKLPL